MTAQIIFWILLGLLFHAYIGYGLMISVFSYLRPRRKRKAQPDFFHKVSIIVPAYNEADVLTQKIDNLLSLDYPTELLEIYFVTDGSTDLSNNIVETYPIIHLLTGPERKGKAAAINRAVEQSNAPVIVFTDANTLLNKEAIQHIVSHYADEAVGGVACEKKVKSIGSKEDITGSAEGLYWKYESVMKELESNVYSVIGAAGELFSMRRELFIPLPEDTILDDFILSTHILKNGFRLVYEKKAYSIELPSSSLHEEAKRKTRIGAGAAQAMARLGWFPYKNPQLNFQYYSRRVIRWVIGPPALILLLIINICLLNDDMMYGIALSLQVIFYLFAIAGYILYLLGLNIGVAIAPFYFVFMNGCMLIGIVKQLISPQHVNWEKAGRRLE